MITTKKDVLLFREKKPIKRNIPYEKDSKYQDYREFLKEDFGGRCGYCNSYYGIVKKDYHIDHFVPKRIFKNLSTHSHLLNDYSNLIYACPSCNKSKSGKWPSEDPDITICESGGFVNPCSDEYDTLFYRNGQGEIIYREDNNTADYIHRELKLFLSRHQIAWKIETLMGLIRKHGTNQEPNEESVKDKLTSELMHYLGKHFEMDI